MKRKQTIALVSTSALAAGMAQGAITYSGLLNTQFPCPAGGAVPARGPSIDLNQDGLEDFYLGFDGYSTPNSQKPFIAGYPTFNPGTTSLARSYIDSSSRLSFGFPATPFGTMIDASYLAPSTVKNAYFFQDNNANQAGDWSSGATTDAYIGVEMFDSGQSTTNFGWVHVIYDGTASPRTLVLVDYGYETNSGVGIVAGATNTVGAPIIYSQPASQSVPVGTTVKLQVVALANPAPVYQWKAGAVGSGVYTNLGNAGIISGANSATLTINGASAANMADYIVVITNTLGAATSSPPATLTVVPTVVTPSPQVLFGGTTARMNISVAGLSPTYRWRKDAVNLSDDGRITGSTTAHLQVGNLQSTDAGNYDVVLTATSLSVTSTVCPLTVLPVSGESTYEAALLAAGPVAYYRLNERGDPSTNNLLAYDNAGAFNGVYGLDVTNGFAGVAGPRAADGFPGFAPNNTAALFLPNDAASRIPLAAWNLNTDTATFLAWVNPADLQNSLAAVLFTGNNSTVSAGLQYYWQINTNTPTPTRDVGYVWQEGTASSFFFDTQLMPPTNQWSMVAATITPRNATVYMFNANGMNSATNDGTTTFAPFNPFTNQVMAFSSPEYIGTDPGDTVGGRNFYGAIDEVAVFKQALSQAQLQTIFNAALGALPPVTLQVTRIGGNVQLNWPLGRLLEAATVKGPWTTNSLAVSPYTLAPTNASKFYRVLVR